MGCDHPIGCGGSIGCREPMGCGEPMRCNDPMSFGDLICRGDPWAATVTEIKEEVPAVRITFAHTSEGAKTCREENNRFRCISNISRSAQVLEGLPGACRCSVTPEYWGAMVSSVSSRYDGGTDFRPNPDSEPHFTTMSALWRTWRTAVVRVWGCGGRCPLPPPPPGLACRRAPDLTRDCQVKLGGVPPRGQGS